MTAREIILDLLVRDNAPCDTQCGVLEQAQRDAILHVLNGGSLDVSLPTDNGCVAADHHDGGESRLLCGRNDSMSAAANSGDATKTQEIG